MTMAGAFPNALPYSEVSKRADDLSLAKGQDRDEFITLIYALDRVEVELLTPTKK